MIEAQRLVGGVVAGASGLEFPLAAEPKLVVVCPLSVHIARCAVPRTEPGAGCVVSDRGSTSNAGGGCGAIRRVLGGAGFSDGVAGPGGGLSE